MQTQHTFFNQIQTREQVGICIFDVSLPTDYSRRVIVSPQAVCSNIVFPKKIIPSVFAHKLFPRQTRASKASEFDEEKSSVLGEDIPGRPIIGRGWSHMAHGNCVTDTRRVSGNVYSYHLGLLVTPQIHCILQSELL